MVLRRNEEVSTDNCDSKTFFVLFCGFLLGYFVLEFLSLIQFFSYFLSLVLRYSIQRDTKIIKLEILWAERIFLHGLWEKRSLRSHPFGKQ